MPYVGSDGNVLQRKPFGVSLILDFVWGAVHMVNLFFRSLFHMDDPVPARGQYGNAPRMPGRRMGGLRPGGGGPAPPPACFGSS